MLQPITLRPEVKKVTAATNKLSHSMVLVLKYLHRTVKVEDISHDKKTGIVTARCAPGDVGFVRAQAAGHKMRVTLN